MNIAMRAGLLLIALWAAWVVGCIEPIEHERLSTSLTFRCDGCDATAMAAGDIFRFEAGWTGTEAIEGKPASGVSACDPMEVVIQCSGVPCETTRNHPAGDFWPLAAAAVEPTGQCSLDLDTFKVRPVAGGELTLRLELLSLRTDEVATYQYGPIAVSPPTVEPRASCDGSEWDRVAVGVPVGVWAAWSG